MRTSAETQQMIKQARTRLRLSQRDLEALSGTNLYAVNSAETGRNDVSAEALQKISETLQITIPELHTSAVPEGDWVTPLQASEETTLGHSRIRQLLRAGDIPGAHQLPNGRWLIPSAWARTRRPRPKGPKPGSKTRQTATPSSYQQSKMLSRAMRKAGISAATLAADSGFEQEDIERALSGEAPLSARQLRQLASHMGGDPERLGANPSSLPPPHTMPLDEAAHYTGKSEKELTALAAAGRIPHDTGGDGTLYIAAAWTAMSGNPTTTGDQTQTFYSPAQMALGTAQSIDRVMQLTADGAYNTSDANLWSCYLEGPIRPEPDIEDLQLKQGRWTHHPGFPTPCRLLSQNDRGRTHVRQLIGQGEMQSASYALYDMNWQMPLTLAHHFLGRQPLLLHAQARTLLRLMELLNAPTDGRTRPAHYLPKLSAHLTETDALTEDVPNRQTVSRCLEEQAKLHQTLADAVSGHITRHLKNTLAQAANAHRRPEATGKERIN